MCCGIPGYKSINESRLLRLAAHFSYKVQAGKKALIVQSRNWVRFGVKVFNENLKLSTQGEIEFIDLSDKVQEVVEKSGVKNGLAHVFAPHATGVLVLTEYEPSLEEDIRVLLERLVPKRSSYRHPSNAFSHLRSLLLSPDKTLPVIDGRIVLGTWQSLLFIETDVHSRQRTIVVQVIGE